MGPEVEDRIDATFLIGYSARNKQGVETLAITPFNLIVRDQSTKSASAHLDAVLKAFGLPAASQAGVA